MARFRGRSKYGAVRTTVDGITFASKKEAARYCQLSLMQQAGYIRDLELQPRFQIVVKGKSCGEYRADFRYVQTGDVVVEDVKGMKTPVYRLKKRLVEALYGVKITEV